VTLIIEVHREIGSSYYHKPQVRGVNYFSLMVESDVEVLVKEEEATRSDFGNGFPSNIPIAAN
jgi:hypothetical protein